MFFELVLDYQELRDQFILQVYNSRYLIALLEITLLKSASLREGGAARG